MTESDLVRARRQFAEFHFDETIVEGGGLLLRVTLILTVDGVRREMTLPSGERAGDSIEVPAFR